MIMLLKQWHSIIFFFSEIYIFYLSLPVFSHWQGRLDLRVMIIGSTKKRMAGGQDPGRGLLDDIAHPCLGTRILTDPVIVEIRT